MINVINFLCQIYLANLIDPAKFGTVAIAVAYIAIFASIFNLQGDKYLITSDKVKTHFTSIFVAEFILALIAIIALLVYTSLWHTENFSLIIFTFVLIALTPVFLRGRALFEQEMRFIHIRIVQLCTLICALSSTILLLKNEFISDLFAIVLFRYLALALEGLYSFWSAISLICFKSISFNTIRSLFRVNYGLWVSGLVVVLYSNVDYIIIDKLDVSTTESGYYWMSFTFLMLMTRFRNALNEVILPHFRKSGNANQFSYINTAMTYSLGIYLLPFIFIFVAGESLFVLILGEEWLGAFHILLIFLVVGFLKGCVGILDVYLIAKRVNHHFIVIALIYLLILSSTGFFGDSIFWSRRHVVWCFPCDYHICLLHI